MRPGHHFRIALASALVAAPLTVSAQADTIRIEPSIVDSSTPVEDAIRANHGRASTSIQGQGAMLAIGYAASQPIEIYMVPLDTAQHFAPTDFLHFTLPAADNGSVLIDLMVSPGWRPVEQKWIIHLLTRDAQTQAGFTKLAFVPATPLLIVSAAMRHLMTAEPYAPSSYHAIRGYRIMNVQVSAVFGILTLLIGLAVVVFARKDRKLATLVTLLLAATGLYQLRFSIDLLRFTNEHLQGYAAGIYDEAGSAYRIAETLKSSGAKTVYVCRDGTNYKEKILRYMSYPVRISSDAAAAGVADFAIVMDKGEWTFEMQTTKGQSRQTLHCGAVSRDASKVAGFPDGSVLFALAHP